MRKSEQNHVENLAYYFSQHQFEVRDPVVEELGVQVAVNGAEVLYLCKENRINTMRLWVLEWPQYGNSGHVDRIIQCLSRFPEPAPGLTVGISVADLHRPDGFEWLQYLVHEISIKVSPQTPIGILLQYVPPSLAEDPLPPEKVAEIREALGEYEDFPEIRPPKDLNLYSNTLYLMWEGGIFSYLLDRNPNRLIRLFDVNEPDNWTHYNYFHDSDYEKRSMMAWNLIGGLRSRRDEDPMLSSVEIWLSGPQNPDMAVLQAFENSGVLYEFDGIGVHGFPNMWGYHDFNWREELLNAASYLEKVQYSGKFALSETGSVNWEEDSQIYALQQALVGSLVISVYGGRLVDSVTWFSLLDGSEENPSFEKMRGIHDEDDANMRCGLAFADGTPKELMSMLIEDKKGLQRVLQYKGAL